MSTTAVAPPMTLAPYRTRTGLTLVLVRHGEKGPPDAPRIEGFRGPPLTPRGHRQARRLARRLAGETFDHIYSSDMARSYQTAEHVREHHPDSKRLVIYTFPCAGAVDMMV
ncbi:MAG: phosphoglycerate mutase family protein, partial [Phycisphaeraceae bacterium]